MENKSKLIRNTLGGLISFFVSITSIMAMAEQPSNITAPNSSAPVNATTAAAANPTHASFCPLAKELTKNGLRWKVGNSWRSDSDSFIKEIGGFIGAQWVGVKYGTVICLYNGKENIDFPVAIQPIHSTLVLEPTGNQWSGLVKDRKICQSANVYDCSFVIKPPENITDIYKQIEYRPPSEKGVLDETQY